MATLSWPIAILPARDFAFNPAFRNTRGASAVAYGESQIVASDAGLWKATLGSVIVRGATARKKWREVQVLLEGGLVPVLIPLCNADQPTTGTAVATAGAAVRAVSIALTKTGTYTLEVGQYFSIGERLYRIKEITSQSAGAATVRFWPPLRELVAISTAVEVQDPVCRMRLASDQEMDLDLIMRKTGSPTISFVEALGASSGNSP